MPDTVPDWLVPVASATVMAAVAGAVMWDIVRPKRRAGQGKGGTGGEGGDVGSYGDGASDCGSADGGGSCE